MRNSSKENGGKRIGLVVGSMEMQRGNRECDERRLCIFSHPIHGNCVILFVFLSGYPSFLSPPSWTFFLESEPGESGECGIRNSAESRPISNGPVPWEPLGLNECLEERLVAEGPSRILFLSKCKWCVVWRGKKRFDFCFLWLKRKEVGESIRKGNWLKG